MVDSPECICRNDVEDSEHFCIDCPLYYVKRQEMMRKLNNMNINNIERETLQFGCSDDDLKMNQCILKIVHKFILSSDRL